MFHNSKIIILNKSAKNIIIKNVFLLENVMSKIKIIIAFYIFIIMLTNPQLIFDATIFAIDTWWNNVLPALLPFFIVSEFMIQVGIMECLAVWLEPIMRPIF